MVRSAMVQEIIDMKLKGYSINEIIEHYESRPGKPPTRPTIRKYFNMDMVPEDHGTALAKDKVFDVEPWKSYIQAILRHNPGKCYSSSVYDVMVERFIENDDYETLPGTERTLRTYIGYLYRRAFVFAVISNV
jgi:hypothetical protein